jgi:indolepyruvate ferredoxin oxidoreductase alpha subunit
MKHVGLNVASDPLYTLAYTGVNAGLVIVVADDPGLASSQNEQDTRMIARSAHLPVVEPSDSAEAKDFFGYAMELSEKYDTPVIFRTTTKLSHSQSVVDLKDRVVPEDKVYERTVPKYVMMPGSAIGRHVVVEAREKQMEIDSSTFPVNTVEYNDKKIGFITSGVPYQYVKEACPNVSVLKLGVVNQLPKALIEEFCKNVETVYVFEELEPVIEEQVRAWGLSVKGKECFTKQGEYSANMLRRVLVGCTDCTYEKAQVPARPPVMCAGCPHRGVFYVLNKLKLTVNGDIGCYTLGAVPPLSAVDTCVCMGASVGMAHGFKKATGGASKNVAVIGDSTFLHSGVTGLINAVYNQSGITLMILDNSTTGMTGHQQHPATGKNLKGEPAPVVLLDELCKACGVKDLQIVDAYDVKAVEKAVKAAISSDEVSVIIAQRPCALLKTVKYCNLC